VCGETQVKGKYDLLYATKAFRRNRDILITSLFLNLLTRLRKVANFTHRPLYPQEITPISIE
jgi:hypothetical protein